MGPPARPTFADDAAHAGAAVAGYSELFPRVTTTDSLTAAKWARRMTGRGARGGSATASSTEESDSAVIAQGPPTGYRQDAKLYRDRGEISEAQFQDINKNGVSLRATLAANEAAQEREEARRAASAPARVTPLFAGAAARSLASTFHEVARQGVAAAIAAARPVSSGGGRKRGKVVPEGSQSADEAPVDDPMEGVDV